ncbi:MAG: hypothetical protein IKI84_08385 [Clostridia bacterium]|nr:hypothetical protein [Clostridia bacterium]
MNAFADSLFSTLLGWVRGLMQSLWSFFSSGGSGGFFAWIGDHYLAVTAFMCLIGLAADLLIGLFRENPSPLARELRTLVFPRMDGMGKEERKRFDRGYEDGIDMQDLNPDGEGHIPLFESNYPPQDEEYAFPAEETEEAGYTERAKEVPDPWRIPEAVNDAPAAVPEERRRRGDRYENHEKKRLFRHVNSLIPDDGEQGLLDRLPTSVDRKDAFHEPVYPNRRPR